MKGIRAHGILLAVTLVFAYQAWKPSEPRPTNTNPDGTVTIWEVAPDQVHTVTYTWPSRTTVLEQREDQRGSYLWGTSLQPDPADSAGSAAPAEEFPLGQQGEDIWERVAMLRGLRDLGVIADSAKSQYGLDETDRRLTVSGSDTERTLEIGATIYGTSQRYALDPATGRAYVLGDQIVRALEGGSSALMLRTLHRFALSDVATVTVRGTTTERTMARRPGATADMPGVWGPPDDTTATDQTFANFMNNVQGLAFASFAPTARLDTMELLVRIDYRGDAEEAIGFLAMYRAGTGEPGVADYFFHSEATRIPARGHRSLAERVDRGLADIF